MRDGVQLLRFVRSEMPTVVQLPQSEPVLEMFRFQPERHVRTGEPTAIPRFPTGLQRPEVCDLVQMRRPILDVRIEDRSEHRVLARIHVERLDEFQDAVVAAEAVVKGFVLAHNNQRKRSSAPSIHADGCWVMPMRG